MYNNNENLKYDDIQNICRTCMYAACDLKPIEDSFLIETLNKIADINYKENDELPKKICGFCINKIKDIHIFALQCKKNELCLKEYLTKYKQQCENNNNSIVNETSGNIESIEIKEEFTFETKDIQIKEEVDPLKTLENFRTEEILDEYFLKSETYWNEDFYLEENNIICDFKENIDNRDEVNNLNNEKTKKYKCDICSKQFTQAYNLAAHQTIHTGHRQFKYEIVSKKFRTKPGLKTHNRTGDKPYECAKTFDTSSHSNVHKRMHTGERPFRCNLCGKTFQNDHSLSNHKKLHEGIRPFQCPVCLKQFFSTSHLNVHKRTHTGERPYKCDVCSKTFADSSVLIVHKRQHTGEKPYKCDSCDKGFADSSSLKRHCRTHTGEKPYKCLECAKTFMQLYELKNHHAHKHTDERPFKCDTCSKMFKQKQSLKKHEKTHVNEDSELLHDCQTCGKVFKNPQGLVKHLRDHSVFIQDVNDDNDVEVSLLHV